MVEPSFAVFKYKHDDPLVAGWMIWAAFWSFMALMLVSFLLLGPLAVFIGAATAFVAYKVAPRRQISLGQRFVVCGHRVAYYKNVRKMVLRPGHLTLSWGDKDSLVVEQGRFPTNARKQHKISANKAAKFQKVSSKIIERVIAESPGVELYGITRKGKADT